MSNPLQLTEGQSYRIIKPFTDYDRYVHEAGETWVFEGTSFLPYDDWLTVIVKREGVEHTQAFRMQWRSEEQGDVIDHFRDYVEVV